MAPLTHYQPFKSIFLVGFFSFVLFVKLPYWTIKYSLRSNRPRPAWTLKRCIHVDLLRDLIGLPPRIGLRPLAKDLSVEVDNSTLKNKARFAWVEGLSDDLVVGPIRDAAQQTMVKPMARLPGYWSLKRGVEWPGDSALPDEKTILHFHGGAFVLGSAHPSDTTANFPKGILKHSETLLRTFGAEYRLCSRQDPTNPFPTAVLDCLAAYRYVLRMGFKPENIIIAGDSAGGNLALAVVRYCMESNLPEFPPPGRLIVSSPCADISMSRDGPDSSMYLNRNTDIFVYVPGEKFGERMRTVLLGPLPESEAMTNPYLSPVSPHIVDTPGAYKGWPSTYVIAGGAERLYDDSDTLVHKLETDGVEVVSDIPKDAIHDFPVMTWHEPERTDVLKRVAAWVDRM